MQKYFIGTSGWQYPEWLGSFYPEKLRKEEMLSFYSKRFNSVEVNYTFNRLPSEKVLKNWTEQTPEGFRFTLKAHKAITHMSNLAPSDILEKFLDVGKVLGPKRGLMLFQFPPGLSLDLMAFDAFLQRFPEGVRAAFEFRSKSWFSDKVYARLKEKNLALCAAESEKLATPPVFTADYGYFRLRLVKYTEEDIASYADQLHKGNLSETYVYFKHEEEATGPAFATMLMEKLKKC